MAWMHNSKDGVSSQKREEQRKKVVFGPRTYSKLFYTSKIEPSARVVNSLKLLTIIAKSSDCSDCKHLLYERRNT